LRSRVYGRVLADDVKVDRKIVETDDGEKLRAGTMIRANELQSLMETGGQVESVRVRSVPACETRNGVCRTCYGLSLATGREAAFVRAVGIMAAQSSGEPGPQLTMRTFHTGGVAGDHIPHGLPRVQGLFEARSPKGKAVLTEVSGIARIVED